jgi:hypothetical protein
MRHWAIVALTMVTALVHLSFFVRDPKGNFIFLLSGLG